MARVLRYSQKCILQMPQRLVYPTITPESCVLTSSQNSITLEEIENVDGFVRNIERIELPNQLIAILGDPLLQKLLSLKPHAEAHQRVSSWLASYGQDLMSGESGIDPKDSLEILNGYVLNTKVRWKKSRRNEPLLTSLYRLSLQYSWPSSASISRYGMATTDETWF